MRATGVLSLINLNSASWLPDASARPAITSAHLFEEARAPHYCTARKYGYRRPYYAPYFCSRRYRYYCWQFYPPICFPL